MSQFDELPEGWFLAELGNLGSLINGDRGKNYPSKKDYVELGIPFINAGHIQDGRIDFDSMNFISEERFNLLGSGKVQHDDILYCLRGSLGKTTLVRGIEKGAIASSLVIIRLDSCSDPDYVYHFLISPKGHAEIRKHDNGSAQPNLSAKSVREYLVPLPPLNEQRRIVEKIEALTARSRKAREALEAIPELLDQFRQSVLAAAFRGDLTADWREQNPDVEPAEALLERIRVERMQLAISTRDKNRLKKDWEELEIFNSNILPETWLKCSIGHIGNVCNGSTPSRKESSYWDGSISWVSSGEVQNNVISKTREKITETGFQNSSGRILPVSTVLIAMIGEGKTRGQTAILEIEATINQNIAAVILDHGLITSRYLWHWFRYQYSETRRVGSGSGPQALNCQRVREMPFILPPLAEQQVIVEQIDGLLALTGNIEGQHQNTEDDLEQLDQSILAKAFRGELVPQDPNDEPAAVLLERIRAERSNSKGKIQNSKFKREEGE